MPTSRRPVARRASAVLPVAALALAGLTAVPSPAAPPDAVRSAGAAGAGADVVAPHVALARTRISTTVRCPDPLPVDWSRPKAVPAARGVTVRAYAARQQGGRTTRVVVASVTAGSGTRLAARGTPVGVVRSTQRIVGPDRRVLVAVNGGYFDRGRRGREDGTGTLVRSGRVVRQAAATTRWVGTEAGGVPGQGWARLHGQVVAPASGSSKAVTLRLSAVNAPAAKGSVAVYTSDWPAGRKRTGGSWEVAVLRGVVVASGRTVPTKPAGTPAAEHRFVLRGSGAGATALRALTKGRRVSFTAEAVSTRTGHVVTESTGAGTVLLANGTLRRTCARADIRPRTMVAWNRATRAVWLVTASGGAGSWRYGMWVGASHHQMALVARGLGATDAVLVDGGGSTTMLVRSASGTLRRTDGPFVTQREVPDALTLVSC